jgi:hypothetical protein
LNEPILEDKNTTIPSIFFKTFIIMSNFAICVVASSFFGTKYWSENSGKVNIY